MIWRLRIIQKNHKVGLGDYLFITINSWFTKRNSDEKLYHTTNTKVSEH